jgi:hypothetical protein
MDAPALYDAEATVEVAAWAGVLLAWCLLSLVSATRCHLHGSLTNRHSRGFMLLCSATAGALSLCYFCSAAARGLVEQPFWVTAALALMWFIAVMPTVLPRRRPPRFEYRIQSTRKN